MGRVWILDEAEEVAARDAVCESEYSIGGVDRGTDQRISNSLWTTNSLWTACAR